MAKDVTSDETRFKSLFIPPFSLKLWAVIKNRLPMKALSNQNHRVCRIAKNSAIRGSPLERSPGNFISSRRCNRIVTLRQPCLDMFGLVSAGSGCSSVHRSRLVSA
jgi:hypothetical protein